MQIHFKKINSMAVLTYGVWVLLAIVVFMEAQQLWSLYQFINSEQATAAVKVLRFDQKSFGAALDTYNQNQVYTPPAAQSFPDVFTSRNGAPGPTTPPAK